MKTNEVPALEITNLQKTYINKNGSSQTHALKGVSLSIAPGEVFGLLGPNGAGKTTLISIVTTLEKPTSGSLKVFGVDPQGNTIEAKKLIGVVPQEIVAHGYFNLEEILNFQSGFYGIWRNKERVHALLHEMDLWEHRKKLVKELSGGMKRRLMVAKALVHNPKILLLDEPTAGVDVELRQKLWDYVLKLKSQGITILLTTHYLAEAESLCGRVGILNRGDMPYIGETRAIVKKLTLRNIDITLNQSIDWKKDCPFKVVAKSPTELQIQCPHEVGFGKVIQAMGLPLESIVDVKTREGTLEEAFLNLLNQSKGNSLGLQGALT